MAIAGLLVDRPVGWNIDEGDLGRIKGGYASVLRRTAYADHFHVGILDWSTLYLISTLLAVPYMSCNSLPVDGTYR